MHRHPSLHPPPKSARSRINDTFNAAERILTAIPRGHTLQGPYSVLLAGQTRLISLSRAMFSGPQASGKPDRLREIAYILELLVYLCWAEARMKLARMTLTIKLDGNWSSFQLANSAPPLSVTDSAIAPSARMQYSWS